MDLPALILLAAVLTVKEAGLPIPIPGDLLVIGAGVAATGGGCPHPPSSPCWSARPWSGAPSSSC